MRDGIERGLEEVPKLQDMKESRLSLNHMKVRVKMTKTNPHATLCNAFNLQEMRVKRFP